TGVLEEEGKLLGKEQGEPSQIRALLVHLDLREVRVVREVEREAWAYAVLRVGAKLALSGHPPIDGEIALAASKRVRRDRRQPLRWHVHIAQRARARDAVDVELSRDRRPIRVFAFAPDAAAKVE